MPSSLPIFSVLAMAAILWQPYTSHVDELDAIAHVDAPAAVDPGPGLSSIFASREVVHRSTTEHLPEPASAGIKLARLDDDHRAIANLHPRFFAPGNTLQAAGTLLQI